MTMKELAKEYRESAQLLRVRLKELRMEMRLETDSERRWRIGRRIARLEPMLTHTRKIADLLEHYYERGYWRAGEFTVNCFSRRLNTSAKRKDTFAENHPERDDGRPEEYVAGVLCQRFYNPSNRRIKRGKPIHGESHAQTSRTKVTENPAVPLMIEDIDGIVEEFLLKKEKKL